MKLKKKERKAYPRKATKVQRDGWYTIWPGLFTPRKEIQRPFAGDWVDPRTSLDWYGKSGPTGIGFPKCPARSESLSWPT